MLSAIVSLLSLLLGNGDGFRLFMSLCLLGRIPFLFVRHLCDDLKFHRPDFKCILSTVVPYVDVTADDYAK